MEYPWDEIDREKLKYSGKNLSECHSIHHKSHMDSHSIEPGAISYCEYLNESRSSVKGKKFP
jgi:hypothetical protein